MTDIEDYQARIRVLRTMDVPAFIAMLSPEKRAAYEAYPLDKRAVIALGAMHKARYEMPEMSEQERRESREWMQEHGIPRLGMRPWPDDTVH